MRSETKLEVSGMPQTDRGPPRHAETQATNGRKPDGSKRGEWDGAAAYDKGKGVAYLGRRRRLGRGGVTEGGETVRHRQRQTTRTPA